MFAIDAPPGKAGKFASAMKTFPRAFGVYVPLMVAFAVFAVGPGCKTPPKSGTSTKVASDEDDPWVTLPPPLGSNIPVRVRRSQLPGYKPGVPVDNLNPEAVMDKVRPQGPPPNVGGNN